MNRYRVIRVLFAFPLLLCHPWQLDAQDQAEGIQVQRALVKYTDRSELGFGKPGIIESLSVREGDRVKQGDLLAKLRSNEAIARLAVAQAKADNLHAIDAAQALVTINERSLQAAIAANGRLSGSFPADEIRRRQLELERARHELASEEQTHAISVREAQLEEVLLDEHQLKAPYDGLITRRFFSAGASLDGYRPVFEIVADQRVELEGFVSRTESRSIQPGMKVRIRNEQVDVEGKVTFVDTSAQQITKLVRLTATLPSDSGIREGDDVNALILVSTTKNP